MWTKQQEAGADSNCSCKGKDGRERGGGDDATTDDNDDDDDDKNNDNDKFNNSNPTIKQCMGVRGRRKTVVAMDGRRQQK